MNRLGKEKLKVILSMLVESSSMRSIVTVMKLLEDAGAMFAELHNRIIQNVSSRRVQCDEIWSFCYAKQKNVPTAKDAREGAGDIWTWTAWTLTPN